MAKIVIVAASRREGNSITLANKIKEELAKDRIVCDIIVPGNQKIYLCTGCRDCDKTGVCDFTDDMKENIDKITDAHMIIWITPVRWNTLSGDMKIMMDRLNPLYVKETLKNKKSIAIAIGSGDKEDFGIEGAIDDIFHFSEKAHMTLCGKYRFYNCLAADDITKQETNINKMIDEIKEQVKAN